ncbi:MAG: polyprenyl synthetase family protein [Chloroflexi bacterium]|nr:polyprenyl synthetase family protein [Chloroflexota bacterium]
MAERAGQFYADVRLDLLSLLQGQRLSEDFERAVHLALSSDGKVLSPAPRSKWPLLPLLPCWGAGGDWRSALPLATAAELVGASSDLFDEIEDGDDSPITGAVGIPRAVNLASALLALAGRSLSRAPESVSASVWFGIVGAADGQHQDLGGRPSSPEEYMALVDRKSAGLICSLCAAGAAMAGADESRVAGFASFGRHLGRLAQLANDMHDLWPGAKGKRDLERRVVSLPLIFVLRGPASSFRDHLCAYLAASDPPSSVEAETLREGLLASGALYYTWMMAETSRSAATAALREVCLVETETILDLLMPRMQQPAVAPVG